VVTSTLGFLIGGSKLTSPDAPLWESQILPIHSTCASRSAHNITLGDLFQKENNFKVRALATIMTQSGLSVS